MDCPPEQLTFCQAQTGHNCERNPCVCHLTDSRLGAQALAAVVLCAAALWLAGPAVFQMTQCLSSDY